MKRSAVPSVFVDARMIANGGIGRHIRGHLKALSGWTDVKAWIGRPQHRKLLRDSCANARPILLPCGNYGFAEQLWGRVMTLIHRASSILWFPQYNLPCRGVRSSYLLSVHDFIQFERPAFSEGIVRAIKRPVGRRLLSCVVRRATRVLAVSGDTARGLIERFPTVAPQIGVVGNGVDSVFSPPTPLEIAAFRRAKGLQRPYLLGVGDKRTHKNFQLVRTVAVALRESGTEMSAVVVGAGARLPWGGPDRDDGEIEEDADLRLYYAGAAAFVMPSFAEGFGIPTLEAMACGTPVFASRVGGLPETVGDASMLLDPYKPDEWVDGIRTILHSPGRRERMIAAGLKRADGSRWENRFEDFRRLIVEVGSAERPEP